MLVPLYLYEYYGDGTMLRKHYEAMGRYVDYLTSKADDHILKHGLGDWFDIGPKMPGRAQLSSLAATATPIYYMDALAMVKGAELLGKKKVRSAGRSSPMRSAPPTMRNSSIRKVATTTATARLPTRSRSARVWSIRSTARACSTTW